MAEGAAEAPDEETSADEGPSRYEDGDGPLSPSAEISPLLAALGEHSKQPVERGELRHILTRMVSVTERHTGPLPHPDYLRKYGELIPNGAERIMAMAEAEQQHRHAMDRKEQELYDRAEQHDFDITRGGQRYGLGVCLAVLLVAAVLGVLGRTTLAAILVGIDLTALAAVFVAGRYLPGRPGPAPAEDTAPDPGA